MDEIALKQKISYFASKNLIVGTCYNHKSAMSSYQLNDMIDLENMHDALVKNQIHLAKEALVVTLANNGKNVSSPKPVVLFPICSHSNANIIHECIPLIFQHFLSLNQDAKMLNIATDGDPNRRQALNSLKELNHSLSILKEMKFFDRFLVKGELPVDYDCKHLVKRIRNALISNSKSSSRTWLKMATNKETLVRLLHDLKIDYCKTLLDPHDKQNVPAAVKLLILVNDSTQEEKQPNNFNQIQNDLFNEYQLMSQNVSIHLKLFSIIIKKKNFQLLKILIAMEF